MKTIAAYIASVLLAVSLTTATANVATAGVYLPCHPNCGPVCVPGGTMKC